MIQSIKLRVMVGEKEGELCFDLEEDVVYIYLNNKYICSLDYEGNFKQGIKKMIEVW